MQIYTRYLVKQFLSSTFLILLIFGICIFLIDIAEISKELENAENSSIFIILRLSILKLPNTCEDFLPLIILFGTMLFFNRLSKNSELTVAKSSGLSIWQILLPCIISTLIIGFITILSLNPAGINLKNKYIDLEQSVTDETLGSLLTKEDASFWSSQSNSLGPLIVYSKKVLPQHLTLLNATFIQYDKNYSITERVDSAYAIFDKSSWILEKAWITSASNTKTFQEIFTIETQTNELIILEDVLKNSDQSIWTIFNTIKRLNQNGINPVKHTVNLNFLIAFPALLCSMVLVAACFSVKLFRVKHVIFMVLSGIIVGFLLFTTNYVSFILSENEIFNPLLGAWWHIITIILISIKVLISQEDG